MVEAHIPLRLLPISILDIKKFQDIGMLSQWHMGATFYIIPTAKLAPDFGIMGPMWSGKVMVEDDIHLRLLPTSILDTNKMVEVLVCCLTGIWGHPYIVPLAKLAQDFGILGHF
jgi:hypothetical protein